MHVPALPLPAAPLGPAAPPSPVARPRRVPHRAAAVVRALALPSALTPRARTVIHVRAEHALVEILAPAGAKVYYTRDGTDPAGTNAMELYLGPFTLFPGMWQLAAVAKRAGQPDSAVVRFPDLLCARDEDGQTVFCVQDAAGPGPDGVAPRKGHPDLYAGACRFPAGSRLREVTDIFEERNVTIVRHGNDTRAELAGMGLMANRERSLCQQVAMREWDECRTGGLSEPRASGLPIAAKRHYIAAVTCGFVGFAARPRKQRLAGALPRLGAVVMDSTRFFRHQPFVPQAVTGYQGSDGRVAELVHYTSLALGTSGASFGTDGLHQIMPPLLWMATQLPLDVRILLPLAAVGALDKVLELLRRSDDYLYKALAPGRLVGWRSVLYGADTLYFYGEWPFDKSLVPPGASSPMHLERMRWRASLLPQPLLWAARAHLDRLKLHSAPSGGARQGGRAGGGGGGGAAAAAREAGTAEGGDGDGTVYVLLAAHGKLALSSDNQQQVITALSTLPSSRHASSVPAVPVVVVSGRGEVLEQAESKLTRLVTLFAEASAVIGVHGPMLSYLLVCGRRTPILEIGFALPQEVHYAADEAAAAAADDGEAGGRVERRWTRVYRLLAAALELPYWAMPAQWVNKGGSELGVDPLEVAAWVAGPAALAVSTRLPHPQPSALGAKVRAVARAGASSPPSAPGLPSPGAGSKWGAADAGTPSHELGQSSQAVQVEGMASWLVCQRQSDARNGVLEGDLARDRPVRVSSETPDGAGKSTQLSSLSSLSSLVGHALPHSLAVPFAMQGVACTASEAWRGAGFMAVDGRADTRWMSQAMVDAESLQVDLGAVSRVCAVNVHWGVATALR